MKNEDSLLVTRSQNSNLKKSLALVFTIITLLVSACDDDDCPQCVTPMEPSPPLVINSIYPTAGSSGSTVAIFGENFGLSGDDNYVTFDSSYAEIIYVGYGVLNVRVPTNLSDGDYSINVSSKGNYASSPRMFTVINKKD